MTNYIKTTWRDHRLPALDADRLNYIEAGIENAQADMMVLRGLAANKPASVATSEGRVYIETDLPYKVWRDGGASWDLLSYAVPDRVVDGDGYCSWFAERRETFTDLAGYVNETVVGDYNHIIIDHIADAPTCSVYPAWHRVRVESGNAFSLGLLWSFRGTTEHDGSGYAEGIGGLTTETYLRKDASAKLAMGAQTLLGIYGEARDVYGRTGTVSIWGPDYGYLGQINAFAIGHRVSLNIYGGATAPLLTGVRMSMKTLGATTAVTDLQGIKMDLTSTQGIIGDARLLDLDVTGGATITDFAGIYLGQMRGIGANSSWALYSEDGPGYMAQNAAAAPQPVLTLLQDSAAGAIPCLVLDQDDVSEGFIDLLGSDRGVITGVTNSLASYRTELNGVVYRVALYVDA